MRRLTTLILAGILALVPAVASAESGKIVIVGTGQAAAAPEVVRMSVYVTSICYETSRGAKDANAEVANRVLEILRNFASDPRDRITASGGVNLRQTEYAVVGTTTKTLCELKWRATNTLTIETGSIDGVPDLQDLLLASIDATVVDPDQAAQTYAELAQPSFSLRAETMKSLRATAQGAAYDDAKGQLDVFASRCAFQDARLTTISPPEYDAYPRKDGDAMNSDMGGSATPIIPDDINVTATWRFEWAFTPSPSCPL